MARRSALAIRWLSLAIAATAPAAPRAAAQSSLSVSIALPAAGARALEGPTIAVSNMFDSRSEILLSSGFVARMTITVELWESNRLLFDQSLGRELWQRSVQFDQLSKKYRVAHSVADSLVEDGLFASLDDIRKAFAIPQRAPPIATGRRGTMYYTANVTVETINSNDLVEVKRWLSGEVQPAIHGKRNPVVAVMSGLQRIGSRLLGGDVRKASASSAKFAR